LIRVAAAGICGSDLHIDDWKGWEQAYAGLPRRVAGDARPRVREL
jgi:threonine dehydrogenase-like Zn-dependent dehydrogenase